MRALLALVLVARSAPVASAQPALAAEPTSAAQPAADPGCRLSGYLEPSVLVTVVTYSRIPYFVYQPHQAGATFVRIGAGGVLRACSSLPLTLRLGATGYASTLRRSGTSPDGSSNHLAYRHPGIGIELEADVPVHQLELGARIGIETAMRDSVSFTAGVRARVRGTAWVGVDAFHITRPSREPACSDLAVYGCSSSTSGVMAGFGLSGRPGIYASGAVAAGYLALLLLLPPDSPSY